jgi:threonylcarbamoyladenosine tRNA methylthiotransferase MtaB
MNHLGKVAFYTLGCKLNFSESSAIARSFEEAGYARVSFDEVADYYLINTCSVTDNADKKCRYQVKRALRTNPDAQIIVIGCYAQLKPNEIASIPGVSMVLGANEKFNVLSHIEKTGRPEKAVVFNAPIKETREFHPAWSAGDRTRTFLKVQDGCNYFCSFCTIPLARGASRSANVEKTVSEARKAAASGAKEIVLTGVNIGDFGHGTEETFLDLIKALDKIKEVSRFRISSIEPNLLSDDIIDFVANSEKFVPHFHIPLQSGSDELLASMRRRYRTDLYRNRIARIRQQMPDACIGVDVIVGFPGESDALFNDTYAFLNELAVDYLHVFTYSERANTTAIRIKEVVPQETRTARSKMLRILSTKKKREFYRRHIGQTADVLVEAEHDGSRMHGFTENYLKVSLPLNDHMVNQIVKVQLKGINTEGEMEAEVADYTINKLKPELC